jgi:galactose-1-phosphate uridylyltransferase
MPAVEFRRKVNETIYHDPTRDFTLQKATSEIRYDPLTGQLVRIFPFRQIMFEPFDWTPYVEESRQRFCPFCPGAMEKATPRFPDSFTPGGRLKVGQAVVVPNLHPYELHTGVVIMSPTHYVPMEELTEDFLFDSFRAGVDYLARCAQVDPEGAVYGSVNWNYLPYAGGSLIHPHLQVLAGPEPSNYDAMVLAGLQDYARATGNIFWSDLLKTEQALGQRYLGQAGSSHWLATFAPRALLDITALFPGRVTPGEMGDESVRELAAGFTKVIRCYSRLNIPGFNAALYFTGSSTDGFWVNARIAGRFTIFPKIGSDVSHLQTLHGDPWTLYVPEDLAPELRKEFQPQFCAS